MSSGDAHAPGSPAPDTAFDRIDYAAVYQALPGPILLLTPDLVMADANEAYVRVSGRRREELVGRYVFDVFPDDPADPDASGPKNLRVSLERVLATRERDAMAVQKYSVEVPGRPGVYEERYWSTVNVPVIGADGRVALVVHRPEEVTALVRARRALGTAPGWVPSREDAMTVDLLDRAKELEELNERLRQDHARVHEIAVTLQRAMLPATPLAEHPYVAVRYRPATSLLNVCGDWYDLFELDADRLAVAVGDVVGHGLEAAGVMGQLRSALSAAIRATGRPTSALRALAQHARTIEGALATTAVQAVVDRSERTVTYSRAGHPPPLLAHPDGTVEILDRATDPPLGAGDASVPHCEATVTYAPGATLVLYTDGLIERRDEDIDTGLRRLAACLERHHALAPERLADTVLTHLAPAPAPGPDDDTALVAIRL
ncbi:PP2C family protein-serine/threonine phosphatase [Streptomyces phyllanthi]|uniref:SpoIIE family protein phosphatase n=1 Tax=Streptomyces phyllanthi TaxID=1803180 RepID=A0A5N8WDN6_9ACTN|nr:SpoIIE family protein phosphatase [Streptomyces phyllanthi]MPY44265.1 SpoIIE family protein phosphatase [Streptomyces phyllanthi]